MVKEVLKELYTRDLKKLRLEIEQYSDEETLWKTENSIKNSGGNLCLHIIGNLMTYIGNGLADIAYIRQRDLEFSATFIDRKIMYQQIEDAITVINEGLDTLTNEQFLNDNFPMKIWPEETSMAFTIIHLHSHLTYHLGQINYHRRLLDKQSK